MSVWKRIGKFTDVKRNFEFAQRLWYSNSHQSDVETKVQLARQVLDISEKEASLLVTQFRRQFKGSEGRFVKLLQVLQDTRLFSGSIFNYPKILKFLPATIEQRYNRLRELGMNKVTPADIIRFNSIVTKPITELQNLRIIPPDVQPLDIMISHLDGPPSYNSLLKTKYSNLLTQPVHDIHQILVLEYLTWRLSADHQQVVSIINKYVSVPNRSMSVLVQTCGLLIEDLGFPPEKIINNGFVLNLNPNNVRQLLDELLVLCGVPVKVMLLKFPRILTIQTDHLKAINDCLLEQQISAEQVLKCGNVFTLKPSTLRERFEHVSQVQEFQAVRKFPRFLHLIYYQEKALNRLEQLKNLGFTTVTIDALSTSEQYFQNLVDSIENRQIRQSIVTYIAERFKMSKTKIQHKLQAHSVDENNVSKLSVKEVIDYLIEKRFAHTEIFDCLPIVLQKQEEIDVVINFVLINRDVTRLPLPPTRVLALVLQALTVNRKVSPKAKSKKSKTFEITSHLKELKYGRYRYRSDLVLCPQTTENDQQ